MGTPIINPAFKLPTIGSVGRGIVEGAGRTAKNVTAGAIAAAALPFTYGGLLLSNQLNSTIQMNNPLNYLQGITNITRPLAGQFTRTYNQVGGGRQQIQQQPMAGGGQIDLTPVVAQLAEIKLLTDQSSKTQQLLLTDQTKQRILIKDTRDFAKIIKEESLKVTKLTSDSYKMLTNQTKLIEKTNSLIGEQIKALKGGNSGSGGNISTGSKLETALDSILKKFPNDANKIFDAIAGIQRHEKIQSGFMRSILDDLEELKKNGGQPSQSLFDRINAAKAAEESAGQVPARTTTPGSEPRPQSQGNNWLAGLAGIIGGIFGAGVLRLLNPLNLIRGILQGVLGLLGGILNGIVRLGASIISGIGRAISGAVSTTARGIGRFLGIGGEAAAEGAAVGAAETGSRFVPGVGNWVAAGVSGGLAANDFAHGNWLGGAVNTVATGVSFIPVAGPWAALGLNAASTLTNADMSRSAGQWIQNTVSGTPHAPVASTAARSNTQRVQQISTPPRPTQQSSQPVNVNNVTTTNNIQNGNSQGQNVVVSNEMSLAELSRNLWYRHINF